MLDIEGTTTSISFVYDALFPFARARMRAFLAERFDDPGVRADVARLGDGSARDADEAATIALALMDADVKDTGLKGLQGRIWADGYASGELRGHVFADVPTALREFAQRQIPVHIYSSGSVAAQKLLFGASEAGDLTPLLHGYFDTTTGPKKDAESYRAIAAAVGLPPTALLFATDNLDEARAARHAGLQVAVSVRPGNPPLPPHDFRVVRTLDELLDEA
ncbi:MAG: acireductone synthase [Deltaproteobacteria bacterium]|nr:MAG: acireductone synthase [Deltaproteobacteria bacterium]